MLRTFALISAALVSLAAHASLAPIRVDASCELKVNGNAANLVLMTYEVMDQGRPIEQTVATIFSSTGTEGRFEVVRLVDPDLYSAPVRFLGDNFTLEISRSGPVSNDGLDAAQLEATIANGVKLQQTLRCHLN